MNVILRRIGEFADGQILRQYLVDSELLHLLYIPGQTGFGEVERIDIHREVLGIVGVGHHEGTRTAVQVRIHIQLFLRSEPAQTPVEVGVVGAVLIKSEWTNPAEKFFLSTFLDEGDGVVKEAQVAVFAHIFTAHHISAHEANILLVGAIEGLEAVHRCAGNSADISRLDSHRTADCHSSADIINSLGKELAYGSAALQRDGPYYISLTDRADVADLNAYISHRIFAFEEVLVNALQSGKCRALVSLLVEAHVYSAFAEFVQGIDTGLDGSDFRLKSVIRFCSIWR